MVEYEADDAIAAAAVRFGDDPRVERILICTPDKDMAQLVRDERIVLWDRRRGLTYDDAGVRAKWGVPPVSIPDYLAVVGDSSDGYPGIPGWGAKGAAAILATYGHLEDVPAKASTWEVPGVSGGRAMTLAASLRDHMDEALLYRDLARLRTAEDGVRIRQRTRTSCAGTAPRARHGRPSATNGASTGCGRDRTAGSTDRTSARPRVSRRARAASAWWAAGAARMPIDAGAWAKSNHGPPSIAVTIAPPRSAISPAAATSQADRPPCWMNASNRPLATYARASAAEPIVRGMRIALRTLRARVATARPLSDIEMTKSVSLSLSDAVTAWLDEPRSSSVAGPSRSPRTSRAGSGRG